MEKSKCNSFEGGYHEDAEDCKRCKREFPDEYTACKRKTLKLPDNKQKEKPSRISVLKLCTRLVLEGKDKTQTICIMTKKCIELGLDEKTAKQKANNTWCYLKWKKEKDKNG